MKSWMIRHRDLTFTRPISSDEMIEKIETGDVLASDEISEASGYWFSIQEVDEVRKHFGEDINLSSLLPKGVDKTSSTATNTNIVLEKSHTDKIYPKSATTVAPSIIEKRSAPVSSPIPVRTASDEAPLGPRLAFGGVLMVIFCGTLLALWLGSQ